MSKLQLRRFRASMGLNAKDLAARAGVAEQTISEAERGRRQIRLVTAYAIVNALNAIRKERDLPADLDIDSFDWNVEE